MENIRQAIERARQCGREQQGGTYFDAPRLQAAQAIDETTEDTATQQVELDPAHLESQRIVAYDGRDPRSRAFDMLRTEVLRSMDLKGWKTLGVTSATPSCGKTVISINLALSIARQSRRQTSLVDLDLRKPKVATSLGLNCQNGVLEVLEQQVPLRYAVLQANVGGSRLEVIPTASCSNSSDLVASAAMNRFLQDLVSQPGIVVLDLPPLLTGHDVSSMLPQIDSMLLVATVGTTTPSEIQECKKYLQTTDVLGVVLNKVPQCMTTYAYY